MSKQYYSYDLETYPNIFTFCGKFTGSDQTYLYEISDRKDERQELLTHLSYLRNVNVEMVGFNNVGFDYPIIHELMINPYTFTYTRASQMADTIINAQRKGFKVSPIRFKDRIIPQIDIYKICHFDNRAKSTSLKALQFAMRSHSLEDLPFKIRPLNDQEKDVLCEYNVHDVTETEKFFLKNEFQLEMRREYLADGILRGDTLNYNDTKIGTEYLISRLGRNKCFTGSKPKQTFRDYVKFSDIILPKIHFRTEIYKDVLTHFNDQSWKPEGTQFKHKTNLAGLEYVFGIGGLHSSADNKIFKSNNEYQIIDVDVASMYPSIAITNNFGPEHLGQSFIEVYKQIRADRKRYAKGTSRNAALKLALNGAYGNFNNPYSPLYDPKCMLSITINGQLQLLQLVEMFSLIPDLEIIQTNTDGITVYIKKDRIPLFKMWCQIWEGMTGLDLEEVLYSRMWIRDVNNYISETEDGKLKRKGAYWYPLNELDYDGWWNKDYSNLASKIAAEKVHTHSWPVEVAIKLVTNPFDFMLRYKATGQSQLFIGDVEQLKTVRYYVSKTGEPMKKIAPPKGEVGQFKRKSKLTDVFFKQVMLQIGKDIWDERVHTKNKSKYGIVETSVQSGWKVKQCNVATDFDWDDIEWDYYVQESKKILIGSK